MSLIPWSSRDTSTVPRIRSLQEEFADLLRSFPGWTSLPSSMSFAFTPAVDVRDNDKHITVTAELPGVDRKDVKLDVNGDALTIRGEKREDKTEKSENWWRRESSHGTFMRRVVLPVEVDADHTEAKLQNGILEIRLPKATATRGKSIVVG